MKLKISDFKKSGWTSINKYTAYFSNNKYYIEVAYEDENIADVIVVFPNSLITEMQLDIDDISTVEEIEELAENMHNVICKFKGENCGVDQY